MKNSTELLSIAGSVASLIGLALAAPNISLDNNASGKVALIVSCVIVIFASLMVASIVNERIHWSEGKLHEFPIDVFAVSILTICILSALCIVVFDEIVAKSEVGGPSNGVAHVSMLSFNISIILNIFLNEEDTDVDDGVAILAVLYIPVHFVLLIPYWLMRSLIY